MLTFQCDTGYMPQEEVTSTCLSNSSWVPLPDCNTIDAGTLWFLLTQTWAPSVTVYTCSSKFLVENFPFSDCNSNYSFMLYSTGDIIYIQNLTQPQ